MNQETKEPDLIEQLIAYSVWMEESKEEREEFLKGKKISGTNQSRKGVD